MKTEQLIEKLGDIRPEYVDEAAPRETARLKRPVWRYVSGIAAALVLVFGVGLMLKAVLRPGADGLTDGADIPHSGEETGEVTEGTVPVEGVGPEVDATAVPGDTLPGDTLPGNDAPGSAESPIAALIAPIAEESDVIMLARCTERDGLTARFTPVTVWRGEAEGAIELALSEAFGQNESPAPGEECLLFLKEVPSGGYEAAAVVCRTENGVCFPGEWETEGIGLEEIGEFIEREIIK